MIVVITDEAEADLERIGDFIARDNPLRAVSFVSELVDRCHDLADTSQAFPFVPHHEQTGVRRRPHGRYLIFYRASAARIEVLHVLHGAQDYEAVLFPVD